MGPYTTTFPNKIGHGTTLGLGHLGYLPKFCEVQDAIFTIKSSNGYDFTYILTEDHCTIRKSNIPGSFEKK